MVDKLRFILENYLELKKGKKTDSNILFQKLCIEAKEELEKHIKNTDRYLVKGSVGVGVWSEVPWLAIFDRFITTTAQKGYYPVFLFRNDMSGFYLSLGIGVTSFQEEFKEAKKIREALRIEYERLFNKIKEVPAGFKSSKEIDFKLRMNSKQNKLSSNYEDGCVISKFYDSSNLPTDEILFRDIDNILDTYQQIIYDSLESSSDNKAVELENEFPAFQAETDLRKMRQHLRIERDDRRLIQEVKKRKGFVCECCKIDFEKTYGTIGKGYIEAHHKQPIHQLKGKVIKLDAEKDFIVLCANCHKMIHKLEDPSNLEELIHRYNRN